MHANGRLPEGLHAQNPTNIQYPVFNLYPSLMLIHPSELHQKQIAILLAEGFDPATLSHLMQALETAGAQVTFVAPEDTVRNWPESTGNDSLPVPVSVNHLNANRYDALILPATKTEADQLRRHPQAVQFAGHFLSDGKPVAALGYGCAVLLENGRIGNRQVSADSSLKTAVQEAGGQWSHESMVADRGMLTAGSGADLTEFTRRMIDHIREGVSVAGRGIAARGSLPGEGADVPSHGAPD
jgi:protease I